jgi:hypothetical protein
MAVTVALVEVGGVLDSSVASAVQSVLSVSAFACSTFFSAVSAQGVFAVTLVALDAQAKFASNVEVSALDRRRAVEILFTSGVASCSAVAGVEVVVEVVPCVPLGYPLRPNPPGPCASRAAVIRAGITKSLNLTIIVVELLRIY